ncbi:MAG: hypothetical protein ACI9GZ_003392 [Bacteroidia bacterium]|jgi:hypothetical protein
MRLHSKEIETARLEMVRDIFIFSCYTGLSYIDLHKLAIKDINLGIDGEKWIHMKRQKTNTSFSVMILPQAQEIIDKYRNHPRSFEQQLLPVLSNQKTNAYLKEIATLCGIKKTLTFHVARHTFATTVTLNNGVPIETVSRMLGHTKLATTQIYAKVVESKIGEDMAILKAKLAGKLDKWYMNQLEQSRFNGYIKSIYQEKSRIKNQLMHIAFSSLKDQVVERHIQTYQSKLIILSNQVTRTIKSNAFPKLGDIKSNNKYLQIRVILSDTLMEVLTFIEDHFTNFFSENAPIPDAYFRQSKSYLEQQIRDFKQLGEIKNISAELSSIYMDPIYAFQKAPKGTTFKQLIYAKNYLKNIRNLLTSRLSGFKLERELISSMIYLNLNTYQFYHFVAKKITKHYQAKISFANQLATLNLFKKLILQSQTKPDFEYIAQTESIKEQLTKWVTEELAYFSTRRQIEIKFAEPAFNQKIPQPAEKMVSSLSVAQLAYSLKLMVKTNLFKPDSPTKLIDFIAANFSTANQGEISKASLKNKYYSADFSTVEDVQKIMKEMVALAEQDKTLH